MEATKKLQFSWKTKKQVINGRIVFEWTVRKFLPLDTPINGIYGISGVEKRGYAKTRNIAKRTAQKWMMYFKATQEKELLNA